MKIITQLSVLFGIYALGQFVSMLLPFPFPGTVLGMVFLLLFLFAGLVKERHIQETGDFLLRNMAVFFVPSGVTILEHLDLLSGNLLPIVFICFVTTVITFAATGLSVKFVLWLQGKRGGSAG